jgi:hypothetical protein
VTGGRFACSRRCMSHHAVDILIMCRPISLLIVAWRNYDFQFEQVIKARFSISNFKDVRVSQQEVNGGRGTLEVIYETLG